DAQHPGESAEVRPCGSKDRSAGHLSGGRAGQSRNRFSQLRRPLAAAVRRGGATAGTGLTGVAVVLRLSPAPVAQTAHHQRDRALLRGSATENPTYGVLCERRKCGPHHLLHLPEIQSGMENPHPQPIYTSCLTSPGGGRDLNFLWERGIFLCPYFFGVDVIEYFVGERLVTSF